MTIERGKGSQNFVNCPKNPNDPTDRRFGIVAGLIMVVSTAPVGRKVRDVCEQIAKKRGQGREFLSSTPHKEGYTHLPHAQRLIRVNSC